MADSPSQPGALDVAARYMAALAAQDHDAMRALRATEYVLDFTHRDAFAEGPLHEEQASTLWPAWFAAVPGADLEIVRTVVAPALVVAEWVVTGANVGPLEPPLFDPAHPATGRTIRLRGVSFFDIDGGLIRRETVYLDLATLMVELGLPEER